MKASNSSSKPTVFFPDKFPSEEDLAQRADFEALLKAYQEAQNKPTIPQKTTRTRLWTTYALGLAATLSALWFGVQWLLAPLQTENAPIFNHAQAQAFLVSENDLQKGQRLVYGNEKATNFIAEVYFQLPHQKKTFPTTILETNAEPQTQTLESISILAQSIKKETPCPKEVNTENYLAFVVDEKGAVSQIEWQGGSDALCQAEKEEKVRQLFSKMPKWKPAQWQGETLAQRFVVPI
jgi:hypothetical protein